uniref:Serine/threonine-protein phosphatase 2A activator n=1 Tax=Lynx canadensis TaxID=61383 RepID=A0A667IIH9_LYNCA
LSTLPFNWRGRNTVCEACNPLWNISAVPSRSRGNQGLIRMYKAQCLEKFPVIQPFELGSLLPIHPVTSPRARG